MTKGKWFAVGGVILAFLLLVLIIPIKQVPYTITERYPVMESYYEEECYEVPVSETYYVKEPYIITEEYYEEEVYTTTSNISYKVIESAFDWYVFEAGFHAWIVVKNTDNKSGTFHVEFDLDLLGPGWAKRTASAYIKAGRSEKIEVKYFGKYLASFTYRVISPTKTITSYRDVLRTREVTKYREVPKQRTVMETRCQDVLKERMIYKSRLVTHYKAVSLIGITW